MIYPLRMKWFSEIEEYFGTEAKGVDFTMKRRTTDKPLDELDKERNPCVFG